MKISLSKIYYLLFVVAIFSFGCDSEEMPVAVCEISDLIVEAYDCKSDSTYSVDLDFEVANPTDDNFDVFIRNNVLIGSFALTDLPLTITNLSPSGLEYDYLRVCINDNQECCQEFEFLPPECGTTGADCEIFDLTTTIGECTSNNTYNLTIDFQVNNPGNDFFEVFIRNNELLGFFPIADLPITIENFEMSGSDYDFIRVCINDVPNCCVEHEFLPPNCEPAGGDCEIFDLSTTIGECTSDNTYNLTIDFEVNNPGNEFFDLFVRNNVFIGFFPIADLPITIENFEMSGLDYDFIRVCINDNPDCCIEHEFLPPTCDPASGDCEIFDLTTTVGECTSDNTYNLTIDFEVNNPGNDFFEIWVRNEVYLGFYLLSDLPLTIENFEMSGLDYDFIRVCINDVEDCCVEHEFLPPDC